MLLKELLKKLSYGELSNLALSNNGDGTIVPRFVNKVVSEINNTLTELYTRYIIKERVALIGSLDWKSEYYLRREHAVTNTESTALKYIIDTPFDVFTGRLVKILAVSNEVGDTLPMDDSEQWASVFLPSFDCVQLTHPGDGQVFGVTYQALHEIIKDIEPGKEEEGMNQVIDIPAYLENVLRLGVASKIYAPMAGQEFAVRAQVLTASYDSMCSDLELRGLVGDNGLPTNVKLHRRGFR